MENMLCEMQSYTAQGLGNRNAVVGVPSLDVCEMMHREGRWESLRNVDYGEVFHFCR